MHFLDPTNDYVFKKLFGDENKKSLLISFLNSILGNVEDEEIVDVILLDPNQVPHIKGAKATILDVRCRDQKGAEYIVEMQVLKQKFFDRRVLYYAAKAYSSQLKEGDSYDKLRPVIFLGIFNFVFNPGEEAITNHRILEVESNDRVLTDFAFTFVELPKFIKQEQELVTIADKWIFFLKNAKNLEAIPEIIREEAIKEAFDIVDRFNWSEDDLYAYDRRVMAIMDECARIELGYDEGVKQGRQEGRQEGRREGIEEGQEKAFIEIAQKMLKMGKSREDVISVTGLSEAQVDAIEKELSPSYEQV